MRDLFKAVIILAGLVLWAYALYIGLHNEEWAKACFFLIISSVQIKVGKD